MPGRKRPRASRRWCERASPATCSWTDIEKGTSCGTIAASAPLRQPHNDTTRDSTQLAVAPVFLGSGPASKPQRNQRQSFNCELKNGGKRHHAMTIKTVKKARRGANLRGERLAPTPRPVRP